MDARLAWELGRALLMPPATVWVGRAKFEFPGDGPEQPETSGDRSGAATPNEVPPTLERNLNP